MAMSDSRNGGIARQPRRSARPPHVSCSPSEWLEYVVPGGCGASARPPGFARSRAPRLSFQAERLPTPGRALERLTAVLKAWRSPWPPGQEMGGVPAGASARPIRRRIRRR